MQPASGKREEMDMPRTSEATHYSSTASLFTTYGRILFYVAAHPGCGVRELADKNFLTERSIWKIVGDLHNQGLVTISKARRKHSYYVNQEAVFEWPGRGSTRLSSLLGLTSPALKD